MGSFIRGLISRVTVVINHIKGLITPLITTHEPPSRTSLDPKRNSPTRSTPCHKPLDGTPIGFKGFRAYPEAP